MILQKVRLFSYIDTNRLTESVKKTMKAYFLMKHTYIWLIFIQILRIHNEKMIVSSTNVIEKTEYPIAKE